MKLAEHYVEIKAKLDKFNSGMSKVQKSMAGLDKRTATMQKQMASKFAPAMKKAHGATTGLNRGLSSMAKRLIAIGVAYFGARAVFRMSKSFLEVASSVEQFRLRLESLLGSQEASADAMDYFNDIAAKVPFTLQEIIESGTIITAMGADLKKWTPILTDLAAVMGMKLPEAASALGRAFAGGAGAADIFRERGILQIIRDSAKMKHDIDDITKLTLPEFRDVMFEAFTDPTGKMAGASAKLAKTWVGTISMLQDKWFQFRTAVMKAGIFEFLKEGLSDFDKKLDELSKTGKLQEWAMKTALFIVRSFEIIALATEEIILKFRVFKVAVFGIAKETAGFFLTILTVMDNLSTAFEKLPLFKKVETLPWVKTAIRDLEAIKEEYSETFYTLTDRTEDIIERFSSLIEKLQKVQDEIRKTSGGIGKLGEKIEELAETTTSSMLPAARNFVEVLKLVQTKLESYVFAVKKIKTANEELMESWGLTSEAQLKFSKIAMGEFMAMEGTIKGFVEAIMGTFERWAIGQIIPKIMAALPFPINLLATGGAIASIKAIFAGIKSMKEGGIVMQEGIYHLHPREMVLPVEKAPQIISEMPKQTRSLDTPGMPPQKIVLPLTIQIGEEKYEKQIVYIVKKKAELGDLTLPAKVII